MPAANKPEHNYWILKLPHLSGVLSVIFQKATIPKLSHMKLRLGPMSPFSWGPHAQDPRD